MDPFFILDATKSFEEACASLQQAVPDHGFGVLATPMARNRELPCRISM